MLRQKELPEVKIIFCNDKRVNLSGKNKTINVYVPNKRTSKYIKGGKRGKIKRQFHNHRKRLTLYK